MVGYFGYNQTLLTPNEEGDSPVCGKMLGLLANKGRTSENSWTSTTITVPEWKWEHITMDFVTALSRSPKGNNAVWVIIDRLTKVAHFLPLRVGQSTKIFADKYIKEIVRLHGVSVSIVLDTDTRFRSHF